MTILDKTRLLQTSMLAGLMFAVAAPAYSQVVTDDDPVVDEDIDLVIEDEDDFDFDDDEGDTIVVTGSRLRRNEFTSASPLQVIDGELARDLGNVDASDLLQQTTVVQGQQITTGVSTSAGVLSDSGPGSATASLRGLTAGRTLVLVNGRRLAPAGVRGAPSAPDLNLIPGTLVERVEVLLDGASSVYGSDAIAGVVNYQLQRDFEGIELDVFATVPELRGNAGHQEVISAKTGLSNDKGFISAAVEHSRSDGFNERALADFYAPYGQGCLGFVARAVSGEIYSPDRCSGSFGAGAASGPFGFLAYDIGANEDGLPTNFSRVPITGSLIQPDDVNGQRLLIYPEELNAAFAPDFERTSIFAFGEYDTGLYGDMTAYFETSFSERRTETNTAGQGAIDLPADYGPSSFGGGGISTLFFQSTFVNETNVAQARIIGGLKGDLPFIDTNFLSNVGYDVYGSYSRSSGQDSVQGIPYLPRLEQTLSNTFFNEATNEFDCGARNIPGNGQLINCRPLNFFEPGFIFGGQFEDQDDTDYLFPNRLTDTVVNQTVFSGYMSGDMFDIPFGDTVLVGVGAEYREDAINTKTALAGDFDGFFNDPGANGSRSLKEVFGELEVPLIKDKPLVEYLTVNGAARYTEESNFGDKVTYSLKGQYAPIDWLSFRASYGTSFRAPNVGEQFGGRVEGFGNPSDPCRTPGVSVPFDDYDNDPTTPDTREYVAELDPRTPEILANCRNGGGPFGIPGVDPTNLGIGGLGTQNPVFFGAPTRVASGSNPDLDAETSTALSIGGTFEQPWLDDIDLRVAITYFELEVDKEIEQLTSATIVNRCYNTAGLIDPTCEFLTRDIQVAGDPTTGEISFVAAENQNLGRLSSHGIDVNWEFGFDMEPEFLDGTVDYALIGRATRSLKQEREEFIVEGTQINRSLGEFGSPEWRLNLTNILQYKDFQFLFQSRYIDSMVENFLINDDAQTGRLAGEVDLDPITTGFSRCVQEQGRFNDTNIDGGFNCFQDDGLDDYWVHNMSITYNRDTYALRAGINNVFNDAPPLTNNNNLANLGGIGYDIGGRTFFVNATKRF